ncbi:MAG: cupin domain-containing protein [Selenomonadaceae bacterium]|nr:cupin domain-containing protein [Selenomonadaceae bacterium]MBP3722791.1 cupin domain-containing protein [Selenomonadaceae bacterium]
MHIILLSGGSGKRLWPLSNDVRSKQFLRIFKEENGEYSSMIQRVYNDIKKAIPTAKITIAAPKKQLSILNNQIGKNCSISKEPLRRDTFPAIALASFYLKDILQVSLDEIVVFLPVDPYVNFDFFLSVKRLGETAKTSYNNIMLMGIKPTYPSAKYGYIFPETFDEISQVNYFKEKPDEETAKEYIEKNALWNSGVFAMKLSYVIEKSEDILNVKSYQELYDNFENITPISFDYAVVEKEEKIGALRYNGEWKDLGTWNTLTEVMNSALGDVTLTNSAENVHAINELDMPLLVSGIKNAVVVASANGILVSDKNESSYIKPYVEKFPNEIRYTEKSWGDFKILDVGENSLTIKIILNCGHKLSYHYHNHRDEIWTVTEGEGIAKIDGKKREISAGDILEIKRKTPHTVSAKTQLSIIEVQIGDDISIEDKVKI